MPVRRKDAYGGLEKRRLGSWDHSGQIRIFSVPSGWRRDCGFLSFALRAPFLFFFLLCLLGSLTVALRERGFSWSGNPRPPFVER